MKTAIGVSIILLVLLPFRLSLQGGPFLVALATEVSGEVWGTWSPLGNPYNVVGEVRVPRDSTLVIEPGCYIDFQGHYKFIVDHSTLIAIGTERDSIFFTCDTLANPDRWRGIRFLFAKSASQLSYCRIENGKATGAFPENYGGGVYTRYSSITITNNTVRNNSALAGGGICTRKDSTVIAHNTVRDNSADGYAGGILCWSTTGATVSNNIISNNSAEHGAGIVSSQSANLVITDNIITDNHAVGNYGGGGAHLSSFGGLIANNIISGNSTTGGYGGGGIYCQSSSPTIITNNIIADNSCNTPYGGGGIEFNACSSPPQLTNNTICGNSAYRYGGGIYCDDASCPTIANNTIYGNSANFGGGISCANRSRPTVTNTILWGNSAPYGPEIDTSYYGHSPVVTYSDVQGGWPGTGNIDADPIFAGPYNKDFHLRWHSPCIDAGEPSLSDPDGTRSDIGAFYFNQAVPGVVELYPHNTPIVIPAQGGDIIYDGWLFNFLGHPGRVDIWTYAFVPEMGPYGPIELYENVRIPADSLGMNQISQHVPGAAPEGDYVFTAYVGNYPNAIIDSSYFYFSKSGSIGDGISYLLESGNWFKQASSTAGSLPSDYAISQNYPNPFNAKTIINYELPVDGYVKLEVYNLFGQKVVTLVNSKQEAGYRSVNWDASEVSSGLYFYKLTAGDYTETRRMMLVK